MMKERRNIRQARLQAAKRKAENRKLYADIAIIMGHSYWWLLNFVRDCFVHWQIGSSQMTDEELKKAIDDQAAKRGAEEALKNIGLADDEAYQDMRELRCCSTHGGTKKTIARTFLQFATTAVLSAVLAIIWMQEKSLGG